MKVVFFVHCFFPDHFYGTETYTLELAKNYQSAGHEVTVVTAVFQGEASTGNLISRYEYQGIPVVCIDKNVMPHSRVKETYYQPEMRDVLAKVLRDISPDIIHVTHLINHTAALLEATHAIGIPTYATFTDFFGFCLNNKLETAHGELCAGPNSNRTNCLACHLKATAPRPEASRWLSRAAHPSMARALAIGLQLFRRLPSLKGGPIDGLVEDIVCRPQTLQTLYNMAYRSAVAPTKFLQSAYANNGFRLPLHNIHFGVDIDRSPKPVRAANRTPIIGFIGQIAPHKGPDLLIEAFRRLPQRSALLRIYGPADQDVGYMQALIDRAKGYDVHFAGTFNKADMARVLQDIDLLVIPSRWYENSPLVLLNALATHTPVLVSDVEGMTEFVQAGVNGASFARGSVDDLFAKLQQLVVPADAIYAMAQTTHYDRTPRTMALETLAIY